MSEWFVDIQNMIPMGKSGSAWCGELVAVNRHPEDMRRVALSANRVTPTEYGLPDAPEPEKKW